MSAKRTGSVLAVVLPVTLVSGCGGGGSPTPTPAPAPVATTPALPVTLSASSTSLVVEEGTSQSFTLTASYTGTSTSPIVADVKVAGNRVELTAAPSVSGSTFSVPLRTTPLIAGGKASSTVTFRLCTSAECSTVYPGSTQTFTASVDMRLKDWATFQRDPAHTGYVAVRYDTADFANAWSLVTTPDRPTEVAARRGGLFFNVGSYGAATTRTRAVNPVTGAELWSYDLGRNSYFSGPSYSNGRIVSMAMDMSSGTVPMQIIDAESGRAGGTLTYASQFSPGGVPTPVGDELYFQAGYFGNVVYAANTATGARDWFRDTTQPSQGYVHEGQSVAVDQSSVYYFGGGNLFALSRATGAITHTIRNPYFSKFGMSYHGVYRGAPIIAPNGRIVTFTDNRQASQAMPLMAFSLSSTIPVWRSSASYVGHPALRDTTLYAIQAGSARIDRLSSEDGSVIGTIDLGQGRGDLDSNIIVTGSHLFVASATATYAIDLRQADFPVVWTAPKGGALAITPDNMLVISATDGIYAYRLAPHG